MARYDVLSTQLQNTIYTNSSGDIKGNTLQTQLIAFINTLGKGSNFMGILTNSNKPTSLPDGKQFYIGYNNSATALSVNLTAVGLGTLSITRSKIYVVYCDDNGWSAVDIASGINAMIPTNVNQLSGYEDLQHKEALKEIDTGDVVINSLSNNTAYYIKACKSLKVSDYGYASTSLNIPETHIFVDVAVDASDFDVVIPTGSMCLNGQPLHLLQGKQYLITVKGFLWKAELYAEI